MKNDVKRFCLWQFELMQLKQHWSIILFFRFVNECESNAIANRMLFLTTFKTIYFWKINEIIIFKFFRFFARNFVFTTSIFAIFTIFIFISIFVSIDRTLHIIVINFDVKKFIKQILFLSFFESNSRDFSFFSRKIFVYSNRRINFFNFRPKRISKLFFNIVFFRCKCNVWKKLKYF